MKIWDSSKFIVDVVLLNPLSCLDQLSSYRFSLRLFFFFLLVYAVLLFPFSCGRRKNKKPRRINKRKKKNTSSATIMSIGNKRRTRKETNRSVHRSHNSDRWRKMFACLNFQIFPDRQAVRTHCKCIRIDTTPGQWPFPSLEVVQLIID